MAVTYTGAYIINYADMRAISYPVSGAGSNIPVGTLMIPGATAGTNKSILIPCTATSVARAVGLLAEMHNYAVSGDALTQTLTQYYPQPSFAGQSLSPGSAPAVGGIYPSRVVDLLDTLTAIKLDYNLASTLAVASATATALTVTGEIAAQDGAFVYVNAGTGIGQLGFIKSSAANTLTLISALTTVLDATSKLTKILPLFWEQATLLVNTPTAPAMIDSAVGITSAGARYVPLANFISINGLPARIDPKIHHNRQGLNSVSLLNMFCYGALQDSVFHPAS